MRVLSVSGFKNSGKSTLCRELIAYARRDGLSVGYVKRTGEALSSPEGTDSARVSALGVATLLWNGGDIRYEHTVPGDADPLWVAGKFFPGADLVIVEGGKELALPKIWVLREGEERPDYPGIFALYDRHGEGDGADRYGRGEVPRLAARVCETVRRARVRTRVYIDDAPLPVKDFISDFVEGGVRGMLGSLKGVPDEGRSGALRIYIAPPEKNEKK